MNPQIVDPDKLTGAGFTAAPGWAMAVGQIGAMFVLVGAILFLFSAISMAMGRLTGRWTFAAGCICILGAMGSLLALFLNDQFQFKYVSDHSWHDLSPFYKVAAVWSGQQGSFLLWATTASVFGFLAFWRAGPYQRWFVFTYSLFLGSLCGILAYETPFEVLKQLAVGPNQMINLVASNGVLFMLPNGNGLTPSLQNYWVVIHPPTIFSGFGSLTVLFAFAVSAMLTGNARDWVARVRPWALVSLSILGLGLVMGGLWAYETQGWGGFWAWDPVENVSFVPWLFVVAFVHGIIVQTTRKRWHGTNFLLGALPFLLFVYGTFLTRSGYLSKFSVHSFAEMNGSALWILFGFLILVWIGFFALWIIRGIRLGKENDVVRPSEGFTRETAYQSGVLLLTCLSAAIAIGMSVPFFVGLFNGQGSVVTEPLYHAVVVWFFSPIMLLMGAAPFLSWRKMTSGQFWGRLINVIGLTIGVVGIVMIAIKRSDWPAHASVLSDISFPFGMHVGRFGWVMCLFALTSFAAIANLWRLAEMFPKSKTGVGSFIAHLGVATALSGLILSRGLEQTSQLLVAEGDPGSGLGYTVTYKGLTSKDPVSDRNNKVLFEVTSPGIASSPFTARVGLYYIPGDDGNPQAFTWPHIEREITHDVYLSLSAPVVEFWPQPVQLHVGESETDEKTGISVTYLGLTHHGQLGQPGTTFGAQLQVTENGRKYPVVEPEMAIGADAASEPVRASPTFLAVLKGINATDKSVSINLMYTKPIYPIEIFYKPMTLLVWVGTGIMFLGGLLSAFYRRSRRRLPLTDDVEQV